MVKWVEPIFDRTQEDVNFAKEQIGKWIADNLIGNPPETYELKGCLNLSDLNRIEGNIQYISDRLGELQYPVGASCKNWVISDLPTERDLRRILSNVRLIISSYYQQTGVANIPMNMSGYSDINAIEENLYKIKELIDSMIKGFQKSGGFQSGAMRMLPIRR